MLAIGQNGGIPGHRLNFEANFVTERSAHGRCQFQHEVIQRKKRSGESLSPPQRKQLASELGTTICRSQDLTEALNCGIFGGCRARRQGFDSAGTSTHNHGEQVIEVVRKARGKPPQ